MARAHVAIEADMRPRGNGGHAFGPVLVSGSDAVLSGVRRVSSRGRHVNNASGAATAESMI
eukprot:4630665-Pleurochrysis_carterae.AAC.1